MQAALPMNESSIHIATVVLVSAGEALRLRCETHTWPVCAHGALVPYLSVGDSVLFASTPKGAVVIDRLRSPSHSPFIRCDDTQLSLTIGQTVLHLNHTGDIKLSNTQAACHITPNGDIHIQGKQIEQTAENAFVIKGKTCHLN